jgi:hypothetical protein
VWSAWVSLGGACKALAAGKDANGTEELFAIGTDSALWTRSETVPGVWTPWAGLGGVVIGGLTLTTNAAGWQDVFVIGGDDAVWTRSETAAGRWSPWTSLGGLASALAAGLDSFGRPEVYALGLNGTLWWKDQDSGGLWV